jgi:hypothetical protein
MTRPPKPPKPAGAPPPPPRVREGHTDDEWFALIETYHTTGQWDQDAPVDKKEPAPVLTAADRERVRVAANWAPRPLGTWSRDEPWAQYVGVDGVIRNGFG